MCESSDREAIELGGAREGAKRQCYVAVSRLKQLWQSHIVAVFPLLFFSELLNTMVFNLSHYLTIWN